MITPPSPGAHIGSTCTGYGGLDAAVQAVLGGRVLWHCEYEPPTERNPAPSQAAAELLAYRYPTIPNHGDIATIDWSAVEPIDVLTAGFPCQDVSYAGKRRGLRPDTRSGIWSHIAYAISVLQPRLVVIENVRGLLSADAHCDLEPCPWCVGDNEGRPLRALGAVLGDLANLGYDTEWYGLRAADVGAPHGRFRIFILAWPAPGHTTLLQRYTTWSARGPNLFVADATSERQHRRPSSKGSGRDTIVRGETCSPSRDGGESSAHPASPGRGRHQPQHVSDHGANQIQPGQTKPGRCDRVTPDPESNGRDEGWSGSAWQFRGSDPAVGGDAVTNADGERLEGPQAAGPETGVRRRPDNKVGTPWGIYEPAIRQWELTLGRSAPAPTMTGQRGGQQLSPRFVEWLMGLPEGWVTDVPRLSRNDQLKLLGNGVVPQQAAAGLRWLLTAAAGNAA